MPVARAALLLISALGLAGCETGSNLFAGGGDSTTPLAAATQPPAEQRAKMAVAPIVGPPDATSRALQTQVVAALERQKVSVAKQPTDPSDYTLRGYVVAAKEKASTKISYIWDVTDPSGKRVNRVTGEEDRGGCRLQRHVGGRDAHDDRPDCQQDGHAGFHLAALPGTRCGSCWSFACQRRAGGIRRARSCRCNDGRRHSSADDNCNRKHWPRRCRSHLGAERHGRTRRRQYCAHRCDPARAGPQRHFSDRRGWGNLQGRGQGYRRDGTRRQAADHDRLARQGSQGQAARDSVAEERGALRAPSTAPGAKRPTRPLPPLPRAS